MSLSIESIRIPKSFLDEELVLDNSSLDLYAFCPRKFIFKTAFSLQTLSESVYLTFGSSFHAGLKEYYCGSIIKDCVKAFVERAIEERSCLGLMKKDAAATDSKTEYTVEFGVELFLKYTSVYTLENEAFTVKRGSEGKPYAEIGFSIETKEGIVIGVIDLIGDLVNTSDSIIVEHKSTAKYLDDKYFSTYNPNNQVSMYLLAAREILEKEPRFCLINAIRVKDYKREKEKSEANQRLFSRRPTYRTKDMLDDRLKQIESLLKNIKMNLKDGLSAFPMHAPSACYRYGMCEFLPICTARSASVAQHLIENSYHVERWLPYDVLKNEEGVNINPEELVHIKV